MDANTRQQLLDLNRSFYEAVAEPFDQTRRSWPAGKIRLLDYLPKATDAPLAIADIGCGNGRFALMLEERGRPVRYVGIDGNAQLLDAARRSTADCSDVTTRFIQADLARRGWADLPESRFDFVVCLATLQHLPSYELRLQVVRELASLLAPDGTLVISAWQFLSSERFVRKQIDWAEIGIYPEQVDPGDALLPWKQGVYAIRYVHQIDAREMARLANDAGLSLTDSYRADGKEGDLNLYTIFRKR